MTLLEFKNFLENNSQPEDKNLKLVSQNIDVNFSLKEIPYLYKLNKQNIYSRNENLFTNKDFSNASFCLATYQKEFPNDIDLLPEYFDGETIKYYSLNELPGDFYYMEKNKKISIIGMERISGEQTIYLDLKNGYTFQNGERTAIVWQNGSLNSISTTILNGQSPEDITKYFLFFVYKANYISSSSNLVSDEYILNNVDKKVLNLISEDDENIIAKSSLNVKEDEYVSLNRLGNFKDKKIDLRDFDLTELKPEGNFFNNLGEGYKLIISDKTFGYVEAIVESSYGFKGRFIKIIPNYFKVGEMEMTNFNYVDKIYEDLEKNRNDDNALANRVVNLENITTNDNNSLTNRVVNLENKFANNSINMGDYTLSVQ